MAVPDKSTFSCGVIPETIGINIPISTKDKVNDSLLIINLIDCLFSHIYPSSHPTKPPSSHPSDPQHKFDRPKKDTVITKHRKWLAELQRKKEMLESQYLNELEEKKEQLEKFTEREANLRKMANALTRSNVGDENKDEGESGNNPVTVAEEKHGNWGTNGASSSDKTVKADTKADHKDHNNVAEAKGGPSNTQKSVAYASDSKGTSHSNTNRPAWALTETAAAVASEEKTQGDEDELLDFAASLGMMTHGSYSLRLFVYLSLIPPSRLTFYHCLFL